MHIESTNKEEWPHLSKAPIVEALIDIRVELPDDVDVKQLEAFQELVSDQYPTKRERWHIEGRLEIKKEAAPELSQTKRELSGYLFTSTDGRQVVQARLDGFTFSRLRPYETWEGLLEEAKCLWPHYCEVARPTSITRIAARYINRLDLPYPTGDLSAWLHTNFRIAPDLPQGFSNLLLRFELAFEKERVTSIITLVSVPPIKTHQVSLQLDIDAFRNEQMAIDSPDLWNEFHGLREVKNRIFFRTLTEKTLEMYQ